MKKSVNAYYRAQTGVYRKPRLPMSTQFVVGVYLLVAGLVVLGVNQGMKSHWGHPIAIQAKPKTQLVAQTTTETPTPAASLAAPTTTSISPATALTDQIGIAVQGVISKPPAALWSVAMYDLNTHTWLYRNNSSQQMTSASLYKLYTAYGLSKKLAFDKWSSTQIAGKDMQTCVDLMIRLSDNSCGEAIGEYVGWANIDKMIHAAGFTDTYLNNKTGPVTDAEDTTRFMAALYEGKLFDVPATDFLKNSLNRQSYRSGIPAGCASCTTYNKTGNEDGVTHDTAVVVNGSHSYVITVMSQGSGTYSKIAAVERAVEGAMAASAP